MFSLIALFFASFALALVVTPLCRNAALRFGLVDRPDSARKTHPRPVPRLGGIPIFLAYLAALFILFLSPLQGGGAVAKALPFALTVLPAMGLIFLTGLLDDLIGLRPWQKLSGQILAGVLAYFSGIQIHGVGGIFLPEWASVILTVFWLVGAANAVNLIDGIDGLATGVGLFATLTTLIASLVQGNHPLALATVPLLGALCGFIRYNFNPATIFLGDSGSLTIGFLLGSFGVIWSQKTATLLGMTAPLMALSLPLLDTALAIARRVLRGQPVFSGDRRHIHHRLLDRGLTPRRVALLLYGVCGLAAALALVQSAFHRHWGAAIVVLFCGAAWFGIQYLGYIEFGLAGRLLHPRNFQRIIDAQVRLRGLDADIQAARSLDQCWDAVRRAAEGLGFSRVSMRLDHHSFDATFASPNGGRCWTLRVPLSATEFVELAQNPSAPLSPMVVAPFADLLSRALVLKVALLQVPSTEPEELLIP